jgi:hypothetical protein
MTANKPGYESTTGTYYDAVKRPRPWEQISTKGAPAPAPRIDAVLALLAPAPVSLVDLNRMLGGLAESDFVALIARLRSTGVVTVEDSDLVKITGAGLQFIGRRAAGDE